MSEIRSDAAAFLAFAHRLADAAGGAILPHFRNLTGVSDKGGSSFDPVTEADRAAELAMRALIETHYPDHGISGEEFPGRPANGPYQWVLDPIDGTKAFICGLPLWGTLIGLSENGRPALGMMDQPYLGERFWSAGKGAYFRTRSGEARIVARPCAALGEAVLGATTPDMFQGGDAERFAGLSRACRMTRFGGDCYMYCMLAAGLVDIVAEAALKPFDIAPLIPVIEGAGGVVTDWDGGDASKGGRVLAAGSPAIHEAALKILSG